MWTHEHRRAADRGDLRYPSDLTDAEWALIEPMIPPANRQTKIACPERAFWIAADAEPDWQFARRPR